MKAPTKKTTLAFLFFFSFLFSQDLGDLSIGNSKGFAVIGDSQTSDPIEVLSSSGLEARTKLFLRKNSLSYVSQDEAAAFLSASLLAFQNQAEDGEYTGDYVFSLSLEFYQVVEVSVTEHLTWGLTWSEVYLGFAPSLEEAREIIFNKLEEQVDVFSVQFIEDNNF